MTNCRLAPALASGSSVAANAPGLLSTSLRHRTIFFTLIAIFNSSITKFGLACEPNQPRLHLQYTGCARRLHHQAAKGVPLIMRRKPAIQGPSQIVVVF